MQKLNLATFVPLEMIKERQLCSQCGRKRMYFCYDCRVYIGEVGLMAPKIDLPLRVDIVKHQHELNSKSTAVHALLLAPNKTRIFDKFADVPNYCDSDFDEENVVVLFPSKQSISISQFVSARGPIRRVVVLDSTWNTVGQLRSLPQLAKLPWVHLDKYRTDYWRPQNGMSSDYLATIEAIYYACRENQEAEGNWNRAKSDDKVDNLDNLLFWFYFFRNMVSARKLSS